MIAAYGACEEVASGRALLEIRAHQGAGASVGEPPGAGDHRARRPATAPGKSADEYARTFPRLRTAEDALRFAQDLEERQVRADLEALTELPGAALRREAAASSATTRHLAAVRVLQGLPAAEGPFVTGAL